MAKFYIQLNGEGYITDCIEYEHEGYQQAEFDLPLPESFIAGWYKYLGNNKVKLDEDKKAAALAENAMPEDYREFMDGLMDGYSEDAVEEESLNVE